MFFMCELALILSLIIKEVEEEIEWLWMMIHLSFFGILATSALCLTLCQPLAKPHHTSCSSQTLPVSLIYWRVSQVSLRNQN